MTGSCSDCETQIMKESKRCRVCHLRMVGLRGLKLIGDKPLTPAERMARYRKRNPEKAKARAAKALSKMYVMVNAYKAELGCEDCGITDPRVLDLHHRNSTNKDMAVSQMLKRRAMETVKAEMDKCSVLCANCHRIAHHEINNRPDTMQIGVNGTFRAQ